MKPQDSVNPDDLTLRTFEQLNDSADKGELTPDELKAELKKYTQAYKQEFQESLQKSKNQDERIDSTKEFFRNQLSISAGEIAFLAQHSSSDSVRLSANKYMIDKALEKEKKAEEELDDLFKDLMPTKKEIALGKARREGDLI